IYMALRANEEEQTLHVTTDPIEEEGFTLLASGGSKPLFDIVFIHGLQGHPETTWTYVEKVQEEQVTSYDNQSGRTIYGGFGRALHLFRQDKSAPTKEVRTFWPRDILPSDFPSARILTYGYASKISYFFGSDKPSHENLTENGRTFMNGLAAHRSQAVGRPLMLITHSLGGLIVKSALRLSAEHDDRDKDLRDIYNSTFAVLFFGTPHRGSDWVGLGQFLEKAVSALGFSTEDYNLKALQANSEILLILRESFAKMLDREAFFITSFQESQSFKSIKGLNSKIVENDSSGLDHKHERKQGINSNHVDMCKFAKEGRSYTEYQDKVRREIYRHSERMSQESMEQKQSCIEALQACAVTRIREEQVEPAHARTLHWLLMTGTGPDSPRLLEWLSKQWGVFWIQGRPGSGKSTAMKFLLHHPRTMESLNMTAGTVDWKLAGVFFTDRIGQVERSWKGILASMLHQLISQVTALQGMIVPFSLKETSESNKTKAFKRVLHGWDIESLQKALLFCKNQQIVQFKMCYFIDALDENNEEERHRRDVTEYLVQLATSSTDQGYGIIKVCAASRPENDLSELLSSYNGFKIHDWTRPDIEAYVLDKLGQHPPMKAYTCSPNEVIRQRAKRLMGQIVHKAQGVFLWVRLIVQDLRDSVTNGLALGIEDLEERLEQTPEKLREFYALILKRIPAKSRKDSYVMLECVLQARRPLTLLDLWLVLESQKMIHSKGFLKRRVSLNDNQITSILDSGPALEKRIKTCSGGLLEVRLPKSSQLKETSGKEPFNGGSNYGQPNIRHSNDLIVNDSAVCTSEGQEYSQSSNYTSQELNLLKKPTVQVLHQTVREFVSEPLILTSLLTGEEEQSGCIAAEDTADYIFLSAHLFWLQISQEGRQKLHPGYRPSYKAGYRKNTESSIKYTDKFLLIHARSVDTLKAQFYTSTLDEIDSILSSENNSNWPSKLYRVKNISRDYIDFLSFAVCVGMVTYVEQKLKDDPSLISRYTGRPLLRFLFRSTIIGDMSYYDVNIDTTMLEVLLESGADVEEVFENNTALQSLVECFFCDYLDEADLQKALKAMSILLKYGANPNCLMNRLSIPVIFAALILKQPYSFVKCFVEHGASLEVVSKGYGRFIDVALMHDFNPLAAEWIWLFNHGLKVHSTSVAQLYSVRHEHHTLRTKICRNATYHTRGARFKAAKFNPQWSFAEKFLNASRE
ncbi:MAG: hypothetical protein Q9214_001726, partial [Letrouitia sp. 1 TL-2023]